MRSNSPGNNGGLRTMLRALNSRNYRLFFTGQLVSLIGTWLTNLATPWLVYRMTGSTALLGLVGFAGQIPAFLLAPLAGVLVDRWRLHRVLVVTQTLSMLQSAALAVLTLSGHITVGWIYALYAFQGVVNAFDMPARQAFVVQMVDKPEDLPNAIALNSSMFNTARLLGPSVGGVLIGAFGEGWCFAIDAVSYGGVIVALLLMRVKLRERRVHKHVLAAFRDGIKYAWGFLPIRAILGLLGVVSLAGMPYAVLMPVFAKDILHGGPRGFGVLMACSGAGALAGALALAARKSVLGLGKVMPLAATLFGLALVGFAWSRAFWGSAAILAVAGFSMVTQMASGNTLLQTIVEDDKRGRVMSLYMMAFAGMAPLGSLLVGLLATPGRLGPQWTVTLCGAGCMLGAVVFALFLPRIRQHMRPVYVRRGILPAVAGGMQTAAGVMQNLRE